MYKVLIYETIVYEVDVEHSEFCPTPEDAKSIALDCFNRNDAEYVSTTLKCEITRVKKKDGIT